MRRAFPALVPATLLALASMACAGGGVGSDAATDAGACRSGAQPNDLDGDCYADVVVGAPVESAPGGYVGRAHVFLGGPGPSVDAMVDGTFTGVPGVTLGEAVAMVGDVNGDGFGDLALAGAWRNPLNVDEWTMHLHLGGPAFRFESAPVAMPIGVVEGGQSVAVAVAGGGDVNGDGLADIVFGVLRESAAAGMDGAFVYRGGPGGIVEPPAQLAGAGVVEGFGSSVAIAGDLDGDGFAEIVVGAPVGGPAGTGAGRAYVYRGGPGGAIDGSPDVILEGQAAEFFGRSVAAAGDLNGDGFADLLVGAPRWAGPQGKVYVFLGGQPFDATPDAELATGSFEDLDGFGMRVAGAGDLDADGYDDVLVGAAATGVGAPTVDPPAYLDGRAYVFLGNGGATIDGDPDVVLGGKILGGGFGYSVAGAGDVDGDGVADMLVGELGYGPGAVYLYCGRPGAIVDPIPAATFAPLMPFGAFGISIARSDDLRTRPARKAAPSTMMTVSPTAAPPAPAAG